MKKIFIAASTTSKVFVYLRNHLPVLHCKDDLLASDIELSWGQFSEDKIAAADVYVFNNCLFPASIENIVEPLKKRGCTIVWQLDDDYWRIPATNPAKERMTPFVLAGLEHCLDLADWIWVTVDHLRERLGRQSKTLVVPNLVDMTAYPEFTPKRGQDVLWQGGPTHWADLEVIGNLPSLMSDRRFMFLGSIPNQCAVYDIQPGFLDRVEVTPFQPNVGLHPLVPHEQYQSILLQLAFASGVGICPLAENEFNHSKSPLKYLEFAACGLPVVASDVVYGNVIQDGVNGFVARTEAEWIEKISRCTPEIGRAGYEYVRDHWSWQSSAKEKWLAAFRLAANPPVRPKLIWGHHPLGQSLSTTDP